ncbi:MAG TPA: phosphoglycerate dehydrogenase [Candidatus Dormibacteraeota bacterium]|nr:phosphoglycerate dehydrogenase [Candidatus Dormibacteraeota bacterium]
MAGTRPAPPTQLSLDSGTARILVADPIAADGVERLRAAGRVDVDTGMSRELLLERIPDYDALVVRSETKVTADVLERATRLRVVGRAGVGVDNIDIDAATRAGVLVLNAPTGNTVAAAEHAVAMMCALARNVAAADASMKAGRWERGRFMGTELRDKTLGLLGLGKIGLEVARAAGDGLRMRVIAHDPLVATERAEQAGVALVDFETLVREADVLSIHVPLTEQTRGCIGAEQLAAMRPGARVVNVARGGIVDEAALAAALREGRIAGAAVDVFTKEPVAADNPLLDAPNVLLTPHLGASTHEAQVNVAYDVADQIVAVLGGGVARYAVNAPSIDPAELAELQPFLDLARAMGSLAVQLAGGRVSSVRATYTGDLAGRDTIFLTAEALHGVLARYTETRVNHINAAAVARSHGIAVEEASRTRYRADSEGPIVLEVAGEEGVTLAGALFGGDPFITLINENHVMMRPRGRFLVATNRDRVGVIAAVSGALAEAGVNIANVDLSRDRPYGRALMLVETDEEVPAAILAKLVDGGILESLRAVVL